MSRLLISLVALFVASTAQAHTGIGDANGFVHGVAHPFGGLDHVLAMVGVGLFAAQLGGRALWLVPLSFVLMMVVGGACGLAGADLPFVEIGIGLSVVVLGVAVAFGRHMPTAAAVALVGFFAIFHGHAHGAEMPAALSALAYGGGFVLATVALHAIGIVIGLVAGMTSEAYRARLVQTTGGAMALAGLAVLAGVM